MRALAGVEQTVASSRQLFGFAKHCSGVDKESMGWRLGVGMAGIKAHYGSGFSLSLLFLLSNTVLIYILLDVSNQRHPFHDPSEASQSHW